MIAGDEAPERRDAHALIVMISALLEHDSPS
jgi:hypothetical protein